MPETKGVSSSERRFTLMLFAVWCLIACAASVVASRMAIRTMLTNDLARLPFAAGPTAESLLLHHDLRVDLNVNFTFLAGHDVTFLSSRMPIVSMFLAICIKLFGRIAMEQTTICKVILSLAFLGAATWICLVDLKRTAGSKIAGLIVLTLPFAIPAFLADLVNLVYEEAFSFFLMAAVVSLILFTPRSVIEKRVWSWSMIAASLVMLLYLTKSSMLPAAAVIAIAAIYRLPKRLPGVLILAALVVTPLCWGMYQHHVSGRFSTGTSLDGANLHKGNNELFLLHYPPSSLDSLDSYDRVISKGAVFTNEWQYSDWHKKVALDFIHTHPKETLIGVWRKVFGYFFTLQSYGSGVPKSFGFTLITMLIFRLLFWAALASAILVILRRREGAWAGLFFLALVGACAAPYIAGFAYIRHVSIIIYPSSLLLCKLWLTNETAPLRA